MHELKRIPEDFIVEELHDCAWKDSGDYAVVKLTKKRRNTEEVVREISRVLHVKNSWVTYAGSKDKNALTTQYISIKKGTPQQVEQLHLDNVTCTLVGYHDEPLSLGSLQGNSFKITVRNLQSTEHAETKTLIPNFFGTQRFGRCNDEVGLALLRKEFKKACELIMDSEGRNAHVVQEVLHLQEQNYVGALSKIPKKILKLYVHAYQSRLFNKELERLCTTLSLEELQNTTLPLVGFSSTLSPEIERMLSQDGLSTRDFIIRSLPDVSCEGDLRAAVIEINNVIVGKKDPDELNQGMEKCLVAFSLPKGSYATVAINELFSQSK